MPFSEGVTPPIHSLHPTPLFSSKLFGFPRRISPPSQDSTRDFFFLLTTKRQKASVLFLYADFLISFVTGVQVYEEPVEKYLPFNQVANTFLTYRVFLPRVRICICLESPPTSFRVPPGFSPLFAFLFFIAPNWSNLVQANSFDSTAAPVPNDGFELPFVEAFL